MNQNTSSVRLWLVFVLFVALAMLLKSLLISSADAADGGGQAGTGTRKPVWIGIAFSVEKEIPPTEGTDAKSGLRVNGLPAGSPAGKAGLREGDIIVGLNGADFGETPDKVEQSFRAWMQLRIVNEQVKLKVIRSWVQKSAEISGEPVDDKELWESLDDYLTRRPPGTTALLAAKHERKVLEIQVRIEERPAGLGAGKELPPLADMAKIFPKVEWPEEQLAHALVSEFGFTEDYKDLLQRLKALSKSADRFRLPLVAYIQHDPFQLRTVGAASFDKLTPAATGKQEPIAALNLAAQWLDAAPSGTPPPLMKGLNLEEHIEQLVRVLQQAKAKREEAFLQLSAEERQFMAKNLNDVFVAFAEGIYLQQDSNKPRWERNARVLTLSEKVDFKALIEAAQLLWRVANKEYLQDLEAAVRKAWESANRPAGVFIKRDSPVGKILVGGHGSEWYREDAAILLDLDGNDFYTNNAGSSRGEALPSAILIDFGGNDAYEASFPWTQGSAFMGCGVLIDRKGDDQYIGQQCAQAVAALGCALLLDESGNDTYRGDQYMQGVALWGIAVHADYSGDDVFEARLLSQGVGMAGGAGCLLNGGGNDRYYSKGKHPTNYGDAGLFDSWSQGCGVGFRGMQSGGIGLLLDGQGRDRYEAGHFSQGGGYYFGIGLLRDDGDSADTYIGSRYNQGFAAHQAIGFFEEMGGNDFYTTRQAVAQGLSWDETIVTFIDHSGEDLYEGGGGFSQGASAHNGFCLFLDLGGKDKYVYKAKQAASGPNDYHGGKSFSLFIDAASAADTYDSGMENSTVRSAGDRGFFLDTPMPLDKLMKSGNWRSLIKKD